MKDSSPEVDVSPPIVPLPDPLAPDVEATPRLVPCEPVLPLGQAVVIKATSVSADKVRACLNACVARAEALPRAHDLIVPNSLLPSRVTYRASPGRS